MNNLNFWKAAGIRALRTFLQVVLATWTTGQLLTDLDFKTIFLTAGSAAVYSILTSILAGLPEVEDPEEDEIDYIQEEDEEEEEA